MLVFNKVIAEAGLDLKDVRLVRHKHMARYQRQVYNDAVELHPRFETYQAMQSNPKVVAQMASASHLAVFVADPNGDTVFVGVWAVEGVASGGTPDPYHVPPQPVPATTSTIQLKRSSVLEEYRGRVVVDWGAGERAWVQYAHRQLKPIIEIRRRIVEPSFPGYSDFRCSLHEIDLVPPSWREALRAARGVYLLVHRPSGAQYVGSAVGANGFLGRWQSYADGHGGNRGLRELAHGAEQFDVAILQTVGSTASVEDVYALEFQWKVKLGSRAVGLNRN